MRAATLSALIFAAQHLYLVLTIGATAGLAAIVLSALLAFPWPHAFERGGTLDRRAGDAAYQLERAGDHLHRAR